MEINILVAAVILLKAAIPLVNTPLASGRHRGYELNRSSCCQLNPSPGGTPGK